MTRREPWPPADVIPAPLADAVDALPYWFVIGGHAVRCLCPYRPSRDVDFGVAEERNLDQLLAALRRSGKVRIVERSADTVHLRWNEIDVSLFALPQLGAHVEQRRLTVTGMLATKLHAILDRGTRRDFFDLYVVLETQRLGIIECLRALREVYATEVDEGLLLRALTYFADAEAEAPLPHEGPRDFEAVKDFFSRRVAALLIPPERKLEIQAQIVDVRTHAPRPEPPARRRRKPRS